MKYFYIKNCFSCYLLLTVSLSLRPIIINHTYSKIQTFIVWLNYCTSTINIDISTLITYELWIMNQCVYGSCSQSIFHHVCPTTSIIIFFLLYVVVFDLNHFSYWIDNRVLDGLSRNNFFFPPFDFNKIICWHIDFRVSVDSTAINVIFFSRL